MEVIEAYVFRLDVRHITNSTVSYSFHYVTSFFICPPTNLSVHQCERSLLVRRSVRMYVCPTHHFEPMGVLMLHGNC